MTYLKHMPQLTASNLQKPSQTLLLKKQASPRTLVGSLVTANTNATHTGVGFNFGAAGTELSSQLVFGAFFRAGKGQIIMDTGHACFRPEACVRIVRQAEIDAAMCSSN